MHTHKSNPSWAVRPMPHNQSTIHVSGSLHGASAQKLSAARPRSAGILYIHTNGCTHIHVPVPARLFALQPHTQSIIHSNSCWRGLGAVRVRRSRNCPLPGPEAPKYCTYIYIHIYTRHSWAMYGLPYTAPINQSFK